MDNTSIGDRMKEFEKRFISQRAMPLIPTIARLDGRAFHSWCRGFDKPFDLDFVNLMETTTRKLVEETNAIIGYTQSDEITLIFYTDNPKSQIFFDGKLYKMTSVLASLATAYFNRELEEIQTDALLSGNAKSRFLMKPFATFDCRVFQVPTKMEAVNCLIWREQDATRNSILSVGQAYFSHKQLHGVNVKEIQEMLYQVEGINWSQDFEDKLKRGSYFRRETILKELTDQERLDLPDKHEAKNDPARLVKRHITKRIDMPILSTIENKIEVIFDGAEPVLKKE